MAPEAIQFLNQLLSVNELPMHKLYGQRSEKNICDLSFIV